MTDTQYQKLLNRLSKSHRKYLNLLEQAENEYERRFGYNPSDVDDDYWIDSFHQTCSGASVENVMKNGGKK